MRAAAPGRKRGPALGMSRPLPSRCWDPVLGRRITALWWRVTVKRQLRHTPAVGVGEGSSAGSASSMVARRDRALAGLRWRGLGEGGVATAAVALAWALVLGDAARGAPEGLRSLVFAGSPFLLIAGLHARTSGYLHTRQRLALLPRPIRGDEHWRLARGRHRRGFAWVVILGIVAILAAAASVCPLWVTLSLLGDLLWVLLFAALIEPLSAGLAAWLGRRFAEGSTAAELQRTLASGWTAPEAAVHLYVPALGVALALALAMPGQLAMELRGPSVATLPFLGLPLALGLALRLLAPQLYGVGLWEAAPRIHEISRTLAGPPCPPAAPSWIAALPGPLRLDLLQLLRLRSLLWVRLAAVLAAAVWVASAERASAPVFAAGLVALSLWLGPFIALHRQQGRRQQLLGALPLDLRGRSGAPARGTLLLAGLPPLALLIAGLLR